MSFAAFLRGPPRSEGEPVRAKRKQHKYDPRSVEASITLGERVVSFIESTYGAENASRMLESVLRRPRGSQPSPITVSVVVDLVATEPGDAHVKMIILQVFHTASGGVS